MYASFYLKWCKTQKNIVKGFRMFILVFAYFYSNSNKTLHMKRKQLSYRHCTWQLVFWVVIISKSIFPYGLNILGEIIYNIMHYKNGWLFSMLFSKTGLSNWVSFFFTSFTSKSNFHISYYIDFLFLWLSKVFVT